MSLSPIGNLSLCNRGPVLFMGGQSNSHQCGNKTGVSGRVKPAKATWIKSGTLKAGYVDPHHGPEQGVLYEICEEEDLECTLLQYGVDGSSGANWNSLRCAEAIAQAAAAGVVPRAGIWIQGEAEAAAGATQAGDWDDDFMAVLAKFRQAWGGAFGMVLVRIRTTDPTNYAHHAIVRANQNLAAGSWPHMGICDVDDSPLDVDGVHYTAATAFLAGRRAARILLNAGVVA
jgi:hypothetical protein